MVTLWIAVYVPAAGLITGVAALGGRIVYTALATVLLASPLATAIAWIVVFLLTAKAVLYLAEEIEGVEPSSV